MSPDDTDTGFRLDHEDVAALEDHLHDLLRSYSTGLGEYEVLKQLQADAVAPFHTLAFDDSLVLFRHHFVLYHVLHRLAERLAREHAGSLDLNPLCIRLYPYRPARTKLPDPHDPTRAFYLNLGNLTAIDRATVSQILGAFWSGHQARAGRHEALAVLGLNDPVSDMTIKRRYRRLAQECHPDRGGDTERLQALNAAMAILVRAKGPV